MKIIRHEYLETYCRHTYNKQHMKFSLFLGYELQCIYVCVCVYIYIYKWRYEDWRMINIYEKWNKIRAESFLNMNHTLHYGSKLLCSILNLSSSPLCEV
jgi:hypothetical protein